MGTAHIPPLAVVLAETGPIVIADLGCGVGFSTQMMLERTRELPVAVTAVDLDAKHLDALRHRLSEADTARLTCIAADAFDYPFPPGSLNGVLACRWLHFLNGEQLREFFRRCFSWLAPGGYVAITCETPYLKTMKDTFAGEYARRKAAGDEWPGIRYLPENYIFGNLPPFLHLLEPEIMRREAERAGFVVDATDFISRTYYPAALRNDGRESAYILAHKPAAAALPSALAHE